MAQLKRAIIMLWQQITNSRFNMWIVFGLAVSVFAYIIPAHSFADADPFYHLRLTTMLRDSGILRDFPWTQAATYKNIFIDHHFGYHLLLMPFISIFGDFVGVRIATIIFAAMSVTAVAWCLRKWRAQWWGIAVLLLLTTQPFLFRLSLEKAPSLAIGVVMFGYYLIMERKLGWLFWYSWAFVWFYSAWPIMVIMTLVYILVDALYGGGWEMRIKKFRVSIILNSLFLILKNNILIRKNIYLVLVIIGGVTAGLVINPYFPTNIFYLIQIFGMSLKPYHEFVKIGGEWYPPVVFDFIGSIALPLLVWMLSAIVAIFTHKNQTILSRTTWVLTIIWFVYTFNARRQVEYLVPFLVISTMLILRDANIKELWRKGLQKFYSWLPRQITHPGVLYVIVVYLCLAIPFSLARGIISTKTELLQGFKNDYLINTQTWLKENTPPKSILFQTNWSSFPALWYYNQHNYYLTGLDQTFMYEYNPSKYERWKSTIEGRGADVYGVVANTFGAAYLLLETKHSDYSSLRFINRDTRFKRVYKNDESIIYEVVR